MLKPLGAIAGIIFCMFVGASGWVCNTATGQVSHVDLSQKTLMVYKVGAQSSGDVKFVFSESTRVLIDGRESTIADLRSGDKITIDYEKPDNVLVVNVTRET